MKHSGTKTIETQRLILRQFCMEDAEQMYHNWASDSQVTIFLTWPTHASVEVTKSVLENWVKEYDKPEIYQWCIATKEKNEPIGSIGVVGCDEKTAAMEIGYCISRAYWQQGITSEAMAAVMKYLIEEVGVARIEAKHDANNPNSGKVMEKCGLKYEGTKIRGGYNNTGICDVKMYAYVKGVTDAIENTKENPSLSEIKNVRKNVISDETIAYVGILAKLELNQEEKEQAKKDMSEMLDYIDKLNELDTAGVEPMSHIFSVQNVFREDVVQNGDGSEKTLANAPEKKDGGFKVPRTIA